MKRRVIQTPDMPLPEYAVSHRSDELGTPAAKDLTATIATVPLVPSVTKDGSWAMIPLSRLKIHPFNSRTQRTQERIEEVRDMLEAEHMQREPITVVPGRKPDDLGFFYILSGQTRYHAANLAGWAELKAQLNTTIDPEDHVGFFAASIEHNTSRPESDWDLAVKAKMLSEEGVNSTQIQKALRCEARGYRRLVTITELPDAILSIVRENPTRLTGHFCEVLKAAIPDLGESAVVDLAREVVENEMSRRSLLDAIDLKVRRNARAKIGSKRATREFMVPVVVDGDKKAGEFKVMQSRRVEGNRVISLTADLPESLVDSFRADIEAALARLSGKPRAA